MPVKPQHLMYTVSMTKNDKTSNEKTMMVRVSIDLPKALRNRIEEAAAAEEQDFASAVRSALREWTDRVLFEKEVRLSS